MEQQVPIYGCRVEVPDDSFGIDQIVQKALADHPTMKLFDKAEKIFQSNRLHRIDDRRVYLVALRPRTRTPRRKP